MPQVHFIGEIEEVQPAKSMDALSVTFGVAPGNGAWFLQGGDVMGETHTSDMDEGRAVLNHPMDVHFTTSSSEGWPFFVCEVWERDSIQTHDRVFRGCGCAFLPTAAGKHVLELKLWRPCELSGIPGFYDMVLPQNPNLKSLRELIVKPFVRSDVQTESCGVVRVTVNVLTRGFAEQGVIL